MALGDCIEWGTETHKECDEYEDQGYEACSDWDKDCCDWWPCSWACEAWTWICRGWYWVTKWVCVAWVWISTVVCLVYEVITIILTPVWIIIDLILSIPILGRLIREILDIIQEIVWRIIGLGGAILDLIGIRLQKKLRVCVIILSDKKGPLATEASLDAAIESAKHIYNYAADVTLQVIGIHTVSDPAPDANLDLSCDVSSWGSDLWLPGSYFEYRGNLSCWTSAGTRITGYGAAIAVFIVRKIEGTTAGCSLGPLSDYVTVEGPNALCFAHEIAHACGLWHVDDADNLANPACGGTWVHDWQRIIIRNSRHVTYF